MYQGGYQSMVVSMVDQACMKPLDEKFFTSKKRSYTGIRIYQIKYKFLKIISNLNIFVHAKY